MLDFLPIWFDSAMRDTVAEEGEICREQLSLLRRAVQAIVPQGLENGCDILAVLFESLGLDTDIINIHIADIPDMLTEGIKHTALVCCEGIAASLRHHCPFL